MVIGSSRHDLAAESLITFETSSSLTSLKSLRAGGVKVGPSVEEPEVRKCIPIFLQKQKANLSTMLLSEYNSLGVTVQYLL